MAGLTDPNLSAFYRYLHARGETTTTLAKAIGTSRAYVSRMLIGEQRGGKRWDQLQAVLLPHERELLAQVKYSGRRWSYGKFISNENTNK